MTTSPFSFIALVAAAIFVSTSVALAYVLIVVAIVIELIMSIGADGV